MRSILALIVALGVWLISANAFAYPWMIRHDYVGCAVCHADPSGGGLLTPYGRAQSEILLRTHYGAAIEDPGTVGDFLFGAVTLPEWLLLGGDVRYMDLHTTTTAAGTSQSDNRHFLMQADLTGQITIGERLRFNGSIGAAEQGALEASITHGTSQDWRMISRTHWVGYGIGEDQSFLLRGGRMNLPFGLRTIEHTLWVRTATRTDINRGQQDGVALAYNGENVRGEVMAVLGNFQVSPDHYRDRGAVFYLEDTPMQKLAVGVSGLFVHAQKDLVLGTPTFRHAYGAFGRYSPFESLVVSTEVDLLATSQQSIGTKAGYAGVLQLDFEPIQGVHAIGALEGYAQDYPASGAAAGQWIGVDWFFAPHLDARADFVNRLLPGSVKTDQQALVLQLHGFL